MKKYYVLLITLFTLNNAKAQQWITYTTANGLANNTVWSIAIDAQGNKWFGTDAGVSEFNGTNWKTYTTADGLANNKVSSVAIDAQGNKWFGTYGGGISMFNGVEWTTYTAADGLANNNVLSIAIDAQGNKWFGTFGGGVSKFDGTNWVTYTTVNGLASNNVLSIAIDIEGNKLFVTDAGISKFDDVNWTLFSSINMLISYHIISIAIDAQGNNWFGTCDGGVTKFDGINWTTYKTRNGLAENTVFSIAIDTQGNKWFGTYSKGVSKFHDGGAGPLLSACIIKGSIFEDMNENMVQDSTEKTLSMGMVKIINDSAYYTIHKNGNFYICRPKGVYMIKYIPCKYWRITSDSVLTVTLNDTSGYALNANFGVKMCEAVSDVSVDITGSATRAGFKVKYNMAYKNEAFITKTGDITLKIDPLTTFVSSIPPPDLQNGKTITWNYNNLLSLEKRKIEFYLQMPGVNNLGKTLTTTAMINPIPGDTVPKNNYDTLKQVITGSYDPNDKLVNKGVQSKGYTLFGEELTYTIRFQNSGTDTAFNIQIRDTIDSNMDISTMQIVSSSHNAQLDIKDKNVVTFIFENILLPDSNVNEPASNGFVKYSIKPKSGLPENTETKNTAYIYFDFNPAVPTNQVKNTYVSAIPLALEIHSIPDKQDGIIIYPNPASGVFLISGLSSAVYGLDIYNVIGEKVYSSQILNPKSQILNLDVPCGIYFIKLQTGSGNIIKKIVKE